MPRQNTFTLSGPDPRNAAGASWLIVYKTKLSGYVAVFVFIMAPLMYGSVDPIWVSVWCLLLSFSLATAPYKSITSRKIWVLMPLAFCIGLVLLVVLVQYLAAPTLPRTWQDAENLYGAKDAIIPTMRPSPWPALARCFAFAMALLRSFLLCQSRRKARKILLVLASAGAVYAAASLGLFVLLPNLNLGRANVAYLGNLTGPFINRNTAAAFWGSTVLMLLAFVFDSLGRRVEGALTVRAVIHRFTRGPSRDVSLMLLGLAASLCATVMTASRSVVLLTAILSLVIAMVWLSDNLRSKRFFAAGTLVLIALVGLVLEGGGDNIAVRMERHGLTDLSRWQTYVSTLNMIAHQPFLGVGLDNFAAAFPAYRSSELGSYGIWEHAHCIPLEMAAELGIPAASVILAAWILTGFFLARGVVVRRSSRLFPLIALSVGTLGSLHGLIDFSLLVPGYAIFFAAIVGCGLAQSVRSTAPGSEMIATPGHVGDVAGVRHSVDVMPRNRPSVLRVLVATPLGKGGKGGIDRIMDEVRAQIAAKPPAGMAIEFVTTRGKGHIALAPLYLAGAILRVALTRPDVLHVNLSSDGSTKRKILLCRAARLFGVAYVLHLHGSRFREFYQAAPPRQATRIDDMFRHASCVIVLGQVWRRFVEGIMPDRIIRIVVLPNATRRPSTLATRAGSPVTIVFLGHVGVRKGVPDLVEALSQLRSRQKWRAIIAGNGELDATRDAVSRRGLTDRVILPGWTNTTETDRLLGAADILVLPSYNENLPMSVIEAMAHGLAVVTTPVGATEDIVTHGINGILVAPGHVAGLAAALDRLVDDSDLRLSLGDAAAAFHREHLEIVPYLERLTALWRAVGSDVRKTDAAIIG